MVVAGAGAGASASASGAVVGCALILETDAVSTAPVSPVAGVAASAEEAPKVAKDFDGDCPKGEVNIDVALLLTPLKSRDMPRSKAADLGMFSRSSTALKVEGSRRDARLRSLVGGLVAEVTFVEGGAVPGASSAKET